MTDTQKILSLLLNPDGKNWKLALQLMESQQILSFTSPIKDQEIIIHFFTLDILQKRNHSLFNAKLSSWEADNEFIKNTFFGFWGANYLPHDLPLKRRPTGILLDQLYFIYDTKGQTEQSEILVAYQNYVFGLVVNWTIDELKKISITQALEKFEEEKEREAQFLQPRAYIDPLRRTKPMSSGEQLAHRIVRYEYIHDYYIKPIQDSNLYQFTFFIRVPIDD